MQNEYIVLHAGGRRGENNSPLPFLGRAGFGLDQRSREDCWAEIGPTHIFYDIMYLFIIIFNIIY
jgi:hypothetical protein